MPLTSKRVRLAGRARTLEAPRGDPFLAQFGRGRRYAAYGRFCGAFLRPGDHILDVGANIGVTAIIASRTLGAAGEITALEASPANTVALRRNLAAHVAGKVRVETCAVGAAAGTGAFHEASAYGFMMGERSLLKGHPTIAVPVRTLDDVAQTHGLTRVDAIKLDIEGFEWEALKGATRLLAHHDPVIFLEFNAWCQIAFYDQSPRAFLEYLLDTFPLLYLWRDSRLVSLHEMGKIGFLRENLVESRCISDLVAARTSERLTGTPSRAGPVGRLIEALRRPRSAYGAG